jgi:tRNA threonylcarbamoyladenosine biosynthesis protein TsaB
MALILALETSGNDFSVALIKDENILAFESFNGDRRQEQMLMPAVEKLLIHCGIQPSDLDAIAAGSGPGSYTGLRIGMAFASGFSFAKNIPLIPVGTLENIAFQLFENCTQASKSLVAIEARKEEFYLAAWYRNFETVLLEPACHRFQDIPGLLQGFPSGQTVACNTGSELISKHLPEGTKVEFADAKADARCVALLASHKWKKGGIATFQPNEPDYLKPVYISVKK